ncbi:hypothetical protein AQUCO_03000183v1 [Aquilegia coerulea]|uniref:RNA helicase n=1 Tax=Aquilegia coerulea TaxID=218851 RepID=A0A2G5D1Q0_AQUCA|nr:hypothetical protein AQUCO_03000183v1 [Aquilegia coerulea]
MASSSSSYVPPHLRSSSSSSLQQTRPTIRNTITETLETDQSKLFYSSSSSSAFNASTRRTYSSSYNSSSSSSSKDLSPIEPVFEQWKPSERVSRLKPEQIEEVRLRLNVDVNVTSGSSPAPAPIESFADMCLHSSIMKDIAFHEYTRPTSIQAQAMPVALSGKDLLGCAETGSGKTAAFTIPMIQHCLAQPPIRRGDGPLALVLAPTRELAQQIEKEVKAFSRSLESFRTSIVVGGTNMAEQRSELKAGVNIVVATPGRFIDHLQQGNTSLSRISFVVLDEADRMLDMGFEPQIREVMRNLPKKHQTLLFSATMPVEIEALAQEYLTSPVQVKVGKVSSPTANVSQNLEKVAESEKTRCDEIAEALVAQGLRAVALHGGRSQSEREAALHDFRNGSTDILVATDVASRGLDVTGVAHVVNLDLPKTMEDYVHRIGRTGRAGSIGQATSLYTDRDMFLVAHIKKAIADVESGNTVAFATGKVARRKEREAAAAHREARNGLSKLTVVSPTSINVEDKYKYMLAPTDMKGEGAADEAWED